MAASRPRPTSALLVDETRTRNGHPGGKLRSGAWTGGRDVAGAIHRASLRTQGLSSEALENRPLIGICNSWSEFVNCNLHFRSMAQAVRRGVLQAGGLPLEFPATALGENLMKPTAMLYRNLMAMDVEESIRAYPMDAVVLLGGCDKTVPAQLMGAISVDIPTIMVTGGPAEPACFRGRKLGSATDLWHYTDDLRAGRMSEAEYSELEGALYPSAGHCTEMGTASTMTIVVEALGMALTGSAAIPAVDARRLAAAEATGRRAVELVREDLKPSRILTREAFDNAITVLMAIGGSTNAVIHLIAIAGRAGINLTLEDFHRIGAHTPVLANVRPSGEHLTGDLYRAGGVPALMKELSGLLHGDAVTVGGAIVAANIATAEVADRDVIATLAAPVNPAGAIAILGGNLAPGGAVIKRSAATESLLRHRGQAVVFEDIYDLGRRIDDPDLDVDADSVLVLKNAGPKGGPGMPERGMLPIPQKLLRRGVSDMIRISDARMSGTGFGTAVLHISPESACGGPLAIVQNGDPIVLDVERRRIDLDIPEQDISARQKRWTPPRPHYRRGYGAVFLEHVLQANEGCDFDFLRRLPDEAPESEPLGFLNGWIGGW